MKNITHGSVIKIMENWALPDLAYDWDPIGLQIGNVEDLTSKVLITLDVTEQVVDEAINNGVNCIIAHHPLLFNAIQQIETTTPKGRVIQKLIKHDITVYAAHTNLDIANGGINDMLAEALEMEDIQPLVKTATESLYKLVVFVPEDYVNQMRHALSGSGAGHIGNYSHCTFQTDGTGTFMPLKGTTPFIGNINKMEYVQEKKLETIIREKDIPTVISSMKKAHPYEEVAYDLYKLEQTGESYGLGRIGELKDSITLKQFCAVTKSTFQLDQVRFVGDSQKLIKKVAVLGGSGEKFIHTAIQQGADVLVTGDISFHPAQDALEAGFSIIDAGHYIEQIMKQSTKTYLQDQLPGIDIIISKINTNPFQFV